MARYPVLRRTIGRDQRRRRFVATHEDFEQIFGRRTTEFLHAKILEYEEIDARHRLRVAYSR